MNSQSHPADFDIFTLICLFHLTFLATIDVKKNIFDLCTDLSDCYLAVIEVRSHNAEVRGPRPTITL